MEKMTPAEYRAFILDTARTGKLATVCHDGRPHVAPIWIDMDGDTIVFTTGENTIKGKNIRRDPRVNLCVDDEKVPFAYVLIEGIVSLEDQAPDHLLYWATRIAGRYMGEALAEQYGKRNGVPGELLVRLTPTKILAFKRISD
jgi:PPOX class probable F420-dependent enzyme